MPSSYPLLHAGMLSHCIHVAQESIDRIGPDLLGAPCTTLIPSMDSRNRFQIPCQGLKVVPHSGPAVRKGQGRSGSAGSNPQIDWVIGERWTKELTRPTRADVVVPRSPWLGSSHDLTFAPRSDNRVCILFDHRGHGESGNPRGEEAHHIDRYVADVIALLDQLDLESTAFWAYSNGVAVGLKLADVTQPACASWWEVARSAVRPPAKSS